MVKSGWNEEEDAKMAAAFPPKQRGTGNWSTSSKRSGQRRNGKFCREKSTSSNQKQQPDPKTKIFTPQEEELVIQLHAAIGSRWPIIAMQMPGKTESDVKVLWNSKLKKKLSAMGIDPVTHKPFSQILADYGNMGAFPKARTRLGSLSRDLKTAFVFKQDEVVEGEVVKSEVYSQLEVISLVTEASKQDRSEYESSPSSREAASSFSWNDFFLEEAFAAEQGEGRVMQQFDGEVVEVKVLAEESGVVSGGGGGGGGGGVDATSSSSSSSSFVEDMIGKQEEMCSQSQLPCFYGEPFYY